MTDEGADRPAVDRVVLLGYPVRLGEQEREHFDEVLREFQLVSASTRADVPERLMDLARHLSSTYQADLSEASRLRDEASARGDATVDLGYPARPESAEFAARWRDLMAEVDAYCASGALLTLATPPKLLALRSWVLGEFLGQLDGRPPTPWSPPA